MKNSNTQKGSATIWAIVLFVVFLLVVAGGGTAAIIMTNGFSDFSESGSGSGSERKVKNESNTTTVTEVTNEEEEKEIKSENATGSASTTAETSESSPESGTDVSTTTQPQDDEAVNVNAEENVDNEIATGTPSEAVPEESSGAQTTGEGESGTNNPTTTEVGLPEGSLQTGSSTASQTMATTTTVFTQASEWALLAISGETPVVCQILREEASSQISVDGYFRKEGFRLISRPVSKEGKMSTTTTATSTTNVLMVDQRLYQWMEEGDGVGGTGLYRQAKKDLPVLERLFTPQNTGTASVTCQKTERVHPGLFVLPESIEFIPFQGGATP